MDRLDRRCPPGFICPHEPRCAGAANPPERPTTPTDPELNDLMDALLIENIRAITGADYRECKIALGLIGGMSWQRRTDARLRCAELIAARKANANGAWSMAIDTEGPPSPVDMATVARRAMFAGNYELADHIARIMWRWWMDRRTPGNDEYVTEAMWWLGFMAATGQTKLGTLVERQHSFIKGA